MSTINPAEIKAISDYLRQSRLLDTQRLKQDELDLAVQARLNALRSDGQRYTDKLQVEPNEVTKLLQALFEKRRGFFTDRGLCRHLERPLIPDLFESSKTKALRVWVIGSGIPQEAYLLAVLFCEALGFDIAQDHVKIFATEPTDELLSRTRQTSFTAEELSALPTDTVARYKYFNLVGDRYTFKPEVRKMIVFGRHDLSKDPPISRIDLIVCKDVLPYFDSETQQSALSRLRFSLNRGGLLITGGCEILADASELVEQPGAIPGIYRKNHTIAPLIRENAVSALNAASSDQQLDQLKQAALDISPVCAIFVDNRGALAGANARARSVLSLNSQDLGRPLQDLEISYRPADLRSAIDEARNAGSSVSIVNVSRHLPNGRKQYFDISVMPCVDEEGSNLGTSIQFIDVTLCREAEQELFSLNQQLQTANEELQSAHEELETTNEELHSANEELETTNEELQSTNEELETMNEELQSTNYELEASNLEQSELTKRIHQTNTFLESILSSMRTALIVVDSGNRILAWNERSADLWGPRKDEIIGKNLFDLDIALPVEQLREALGRDSGQPSELRLHCLNRLGKPIDCLIRIGRLQKQEARIILIDEDR